MSVSFEVADNRIGSMYALLRDGELYVAKPMKKDVVEIAKSYRPGSKHKWSVKRITVILPTI